MSDGAIAQLLLVGAAATRPAVHDHLRRHGYETLTAASAVEAMHLLARWKVACVVADAELENGRGQGLVAGILRTDPGLSVVLLSSAPDLRAAVASLRLGAMDYLAANDPPEDIVAAVERALKRATDRGTRPSVHAGARARRWPHSPLSCGGSASGWTTWLWPPWRRSCASLRRRISGWRATRCASPRWPRRWRPSSVGQTGRSSRSARGRTGTTSAWWVWATTSSPRWGR